MNATAPLPSVSGTPPLSRWAVPALCFGVIALALGLVFREPLGTMVAVWGRSETYAHGYLIGPIALWLIWRRRAVLERLAPRPDPRALPVLLGLAAAWLAGEAAGVMALEQYAVVAMVPAFVWLLAGWRLVRAWGFALAFLLLAVPFGGFLVPPLMEITADMTVALVRLSGVPVYREGLYFSLPTGNWSVVQACSGIRYLIASVTLGLLYAYLTYHTLWRRLLFVALAAAVPVLANGLRAYGIVMLGHLSGMELAVGADHLLYGWVFFGLVMLLLFWVGRFWQEAGPPAAETAPGHEAEPAAAGRIAVHGLLGLALVLAAPAWAAYTDRPPGNAVGAVELPDELADYRRVGNQLPGGWRPHYVNLSTERQALFRAGGGSPVGVYLGLYADQGEGHELVAWDNSLTSPPGDDPGPWRSLGRAGVTRLDLGGGRMLSVPAWRLADGTTELVVWRWFWVDGRLLHRELEVKLHSAVARLTGGADAGAVVAVAVEADAGREAGDLAPRELMAALAGSLGDVLEGNSRD